jgi:hypothetical protein
MQISVFKRVKFVFLGLTFFLGFSPLAFSAWYESVPIERNDPFRLTMYHAVSSGSERLMGTFHLAGKPHRGEMYIILSNDELANIEAAGSHKYIHHEKVLNKKEATFWKIFFAKRSGVTRVPLLVSVAGIAVGFINIPVGVAISVTGTLMDTLLATTDVTTVKAAALAELMANGGKFTEYTTIRRDNAGHPYLHSDVFYHVTVQGQLRAYLIYSSVYAVKVE